MEGGMTSKVTTKWRKTRAASADASMAASAHAGEEIVENVSGGFASAAADSGGTHSAASLDLGGEDSVDTTI